MILLFKFASHVWGSRWWWKIWRVVVCCMITRISWLAGTWLLLASKLFPPLIWHSKCWLLIPDDIPRPRYHTWHLVEVMWWRRKITPYRHRPQQNRLGTSPAITNCPGKKQKKYLEISIYFSVSLFLCLGSQVITQRLLRRDNTLLNVELTFQCEYSR